MKPFLAQMKNSIIVFLLLSSRLVFGDGGIPESYTPGNAYIALDTESSVERGSNGEMVRKYARVYELGKGAAKKILAALNNADFKTVETRLFLEDSGVCYFLQDLKTGDMYALHMPPRIPEWSCKLYTAQLDKNGAVVLKKSLSEFFLFNEFVKIHTEFGIPALSKKESASNE